MRKIVMEMRSNALAWNPMEPFNFTVANEDHNLYTFDMRKMQRALLVHKDHVSAVYVACFGLQCNGLLIDHWISCLEQHGRCVFAHRP